MSLPKWEQTQSGIINHVSLLVYRCCLTFGQGPLMSSTKNGTRAAAINRIFRYPLRLVSFTEPCNKSKEKPQFRILRRPLVSLVKKPKLSRFAARNQDKLLHQNLDVDQPREAHRSHKSPVDQRPAKRRTHQSPLNKLRAMNII